MKIDKTYIINLDHRPDRLKLIIDEVGKIGVYSPERFPAISPKVSAYPKQYTKNFTLPKSRPKHKQYVMGALGCKLSHVGVIKDAYDAGYENVLIIEDDAVLSGSVSNLMAACDFDPWHFFYLGVRHKSPPEEFKSDCDLVVRGYQTHAYIANCSIYEFILENALSSGLEIDVFYSTMIHPLRKSYVIKPQMAVQRADNVSDIYNR
jgi:hypothetical protein